MNQPHALTSDQNRSPDPNLEPEHTPDPTLLKDPGPVNEGLEALYRWALVLSLITVFYKLAEGLVSVWFGHQDETLALFGFGLDSFIEVLSGIGILHLVMRLQQAPDAKNRDRFEKTALKITGTAFYLLIA